MHLFTSQSVPIGRLVSQHRRSPVIGRADSGIFSYTRGPVETTTKKSMVTNNGICAKNHLSQPRPVTQMYK